MRKNILGLVMAALAFSTIGAYAQSEKQTVCTEQTQKCCKEKKNHKKGEYKGDKKKRNHAKFNPFTGIQLSAEQQSQLDQLKADRKAKKEADKADKKAAQKREREEYNAAVEKILTPEQFKQYKANCDSMSNLRLEKVKNKMNKVKKARKASETIK